MSFTFTPYSRTLQANTIGWYNTGITVNAGQQLRFTASGTMEPWSWWDDYYPIIGPDGARWWPTNNPNSRVYMQGHSFCMLIGKIGSNAPFEIGVRRNKGLLNQSGTLYLAVNDVIGTQGDNSGSFSVTIEVGTLDPIVTEPPPDGGGCVANNYVNSTVSAFPISLYDGEKREEVTDLVVNSPAGALQFVRSYRQNKQTNANFQFMGLGWTHNHLGKLTLSGTSPNRSANALLLGGGRLQFTEDSGNAGHFTATEESLSILDEDSPNSEYVLTAQDKVKYIFDTTSLLLTRIEWPSNETWTYTYASGQLSEIEDGYGRKLVFAYVSNPSQYDDGQLWRVGDHDTSLTGTPTGRYVEFGYTPEKNNGSTITSPKALLASVRDVRGNTWTYDWYGQDSGENDTDQLNFLLEVASPSVDITGDGTPDGSITLKRLSYTLSGSTITSISQDMGIQDSDPELLETIYDFQPSSLNETHETTAGKVTKHYFTGSFYAGKMDPAGNSTSEWLGSNYRPETRVDGNGIDLQLEWNEDGKYLLEVTNGLGSQTQFNYNTSGASADTLHDSTDAQGRKTEYTYDDMDNPRLPTRIQVFDQDEITVLGWQEFTYDDKGRGLTEITYDPADGTTILRQVSHTYYTSGNGNGLLHTVTHEDIGGTDDVVTTYTYDSVGRVIKTQQSSSFGTCEISFTVYDEAGNVVATICNYDPGTDPDPTTAAEATALYDPDFPDKNQVTTYEYDTLGRRVAATLNDGADFKQTTLTVYDALNRVIRTINNYKPVTGVSNPYTADRSAFDGEHGDDNTENLVMDTTYNARGLVRKQTDVLGNIMLLGYDDAGRVVKTIRGASQPDYNNDYTGTAPDPSLADYTPGEEADEDIVTAQEYDGAGNLVKSVDTLGTVDYTMYDVLNRAVKTVRAANDDASIALNPGDTGYDPDVDPRWVSYIPSADPDLDLIETTDYDALGHVIRTRRLLENRPDEQWETTLFGYDPLGRQVRVIRSASQPDYDLTADPDLSDYTLIEDADQDILTQTAYDVNGRVQFTQDPMQMTTWFVYDGLGRQVKTIINYVDQGEDPALWVWDGGDNRWEKSDGNPIDHGTVNDLNSITATEYDSDGRVQAKQDVLGRFSRNVYDTRGRLVRAVTNFVDQGEDPALWVWNSGWTQSDTVTPISHGADNDENILASTIYDAKGQVSQTIDHRNNVTLFIYDTAGRQIKAIVNYIEQGSSDPADWEWSDTNNRWEDGDSNAIDFGTDNDQNRISTAIYDLGGRVASSRDSTGIETRYEYDALSRRTLTIVNYDDGNYDPNQPDQDLISAMAYNKAGQVVSTTDARGTETTFTYDHAGRRLTMIRAANSDLSSADYTCYDKAGRVLRTIQNWTNDEEAPAPDAQDEEGDWLFVPEDHGTDNDRDLVILYAYDRASRHIQVTDAADNISSTSYFKDGHVDGLIDPEAAETKYRYDGLRRRVRVVQGFVDQGEDTALWQWNSGWTQSDGTTAINHGTDNDQNIILDVAYDVAGRVVSQREPNGNVTTYISDQLNRRLSLTNPLSQTWETAYADLSGGTRVSQAYPGITGASDYEVQRDFDRLGRLLSIVYGDPSGTPDVKLTYDTAGNQVKVSEYSGSDFTDRIRETSFSYDAVHRIAAVEFDTNGDGTGDEDVSYAYDGGGLRTRLTLPGDLDIVYDYDERGRLISLTDWDNQETQFGYDLADRHQTTERTNQFHSEYHYDAAGRLKRLRHTKAGGGFPTTGLLDNFNRTNGGIGGNWGWTPAGYSILGNEMVVGTGDLIFWNPNTFSADQEVFVTLIAIDGDADEIDLILKMQTTDWNDGILELWYQAVNGVVEVVTYDQTAGWVQHGSDISVTFAPGDQFGARALADGTVEVYKNGVLVGSRDASAWTYAANGGYVGLWNLNAAGTVLDDFGGGDVTTGNTTLAHFEYEVDGRGNRTQALEALAHPETTTDTIIAYNYKALVLTGTWSEVSAFNQSTQTDAILKLMFLADHLTLTMGKGPDHSIYDLYLDGVFWQSVDGYAASATQEDIAITSATLLDEGPHTLEIRNQNSKNASSSGYKVRFKQALVEDKTWKLHTIEYSYDALARLLEARFNPGVNAEAVDVDLVRRYLYTYDRAGNRLSESVSLNGGMPTVANYTYNEANQIADTGYAYDNNGNLIDDGTNTYTWDRANRVVKWEDGVAADKVEYAYDGLNNRVSRAIGTTSPIVTQFLLDLQPGLAVVLSETQNTDVTNYIHSPRGIHAHKDSSNVWEWMVQDGLGSVREVVNNGVNVLESRMYAPSYIGGVVDQAGSRQTSYAFTGEYEDMANGLLYLRARYLSSQFGNFLNLDSSEGVPNRLMSLNRYSWVEGNMPNMVDRSGNGPSDSTYLYEDDRLFYEELYKLNRDVLTYGVRSIQQNPCTGSLYSPFGCDSQGNPIPYFLVQDFLNSPYPAGPDNCKSGGPFYTDKHCGVDLVSYSDLAWLWVNLGDNRRIIRMKTSEGEFRFDRSTGKIAPVSTGNFDRRASISMLRQGKFQFEGYIPPDRRSEGRKVYAIANGEIVSWNAAEATLRVKVGDNFEIQYTHLADAPLRVSGRISRGEEIGTYGDFGNTGGNPHFHITYKVDLSGIGCSSTNNMIIYENPLLSLTHRFWVPTTLRQPPPHIQSGRACQQNSIWRVNNGASYVTEQWGSCSV